MTRFFDRARRPNTPEGARALYDEWSQVYDEETAEAGYATPRRVADALATALADRGAPILDLGCGTGQSGQALRAAGFEVIDGRDISAPMIERARAKGVYRDLRRVEPEAPLAGVAPGDYAAITAVSVFAAAPWPVFDACLEALAPGGVFALSLNDHALKDPEAAMAVERWEPDRATVLFREHGEHVPGLGVGASVIVMRRR